MLFLFIFYIFASLFFFKFRDSYSHKWRLLLEQNWTITTRQITQHQLMVGTPFTQPSNAVVWIVTKIGLEQPILIIQQVSKEDWRVFQFHRRVINGKYLWQIVIYLTNTWRTKWFSELAGGYILKKVEKILSARVGLIL